MKQPSGPCSVSRSGEMSASWSERATAASRAALGLVALGRRRAAPAARSLRIAWTLRAATPTPASSSQIETSEGWREDQTRPVRRRAVAAPHAATRRQRDPARARRRRKHASPCIGAEGEDLKRVSRAALRRRAPARRRTGGRPAPSSSPARWPSRGTMSIRQQKCPRPAARCAPTGSPAARRPGGRAAGCSASCSIAAPVGPSSWKRARGRRGASISWNGRREAYGAISTASSSIATTRSRSRTSSCTRSPSRLPPIVRTA